MNKIIEFNNVTYEVTDEGEYNPEHPLLFEVSYDGGYTYTVGLWKEVLGAPVRKIWKIVGIVKED